MSKYSDKEDSLFLNSKAVSECIKLGDFAFEKEKEC